MSDFSQGEGWWQASDGKWYPPQQTPPGGAAPTGQIPAAEPGQFPSVPPTQPVQPFGTPPPGPIGGAPAPGPTPAPSGSGTGRGPIIAIVVAVVALIAAVAFFATRDSGDKKNASATSSSSSKSSSSSSKSSSSSSKSTSSSSSASGAPDITAPSGFKVFKSDEDQFAIVIPQGMDDVDLTRGDIDQILNQLEANNPSFASVGPQVRSVLASGGKLFAIDSSTAATTGFADNVNLIAVAGESDVTNPSVESQIRTQLEGIPANDLVFNSGDVNGRPVLSASYTATVNGADGQPRTVFGRQAYFSADGKTWVLTYTTGAEDTSDTLGTMVQSFTVND